jgi:hypothetical protein
MFLDVSDGIKNTLCNMAALASAEAGELRSGAICECPKLLPVQRRDGIEVDEPRRIPQIGVLLTKHDYPCSSADWFQHQIFNRNFDAVVEGILRIFYIIRGCNAAGIHFPEESHSQYFRCKSLDAEDLPTLVDLWCLQNQDTPTARADGGVVIPLFHLLAAVLVGCDPSCSDRVLYPGDELGYGAGMYECLGLDDLPHTDTFWGTLREVKRKLVLSQAAPPAPFDFVEPPLPRA